MSSAGASSWTRWPALGISRSRSRAVDRAKTGNVDTVRVRRQAVHTVTDARVPMSRDIRRRRSRYLFHSGVRAACLVAAVAAPLPSPLRVALVVCAAVLPYLSVVVANGTPGPEPASRLDRGAPRRALAVHRRRARR